MPTEFPTLLNEQWKDLLGPGLMDVLGDWPWPTKATAGQIEARESPSAVDRDEGQTRHSAGPANSLSQVVANPPSDQARPERAADVWSSPVNTIRLIIVSAHSTESAHSVHAETATPFRWFSPPLGGRASGRREASAHPLILTSFRCVSG